MSKELKTCSVCGMPRSGLLAGNCPACLMRLGTPLPEPDPDAESSKASIFNPSTAGAIRLGDYELFEEIARGGMGVVYRARQTSLNRIVAVKVLLASPFASKAFGKRFRREAEVAASLNHRNIVSIYGVGEHQGQSYFSMELVEGRSLADLVRDKPLPALRAAQLVKTIAEAVHFAHQRGVLHRDLKPSNVLVDSLDAPHITDFGLAKWMEGVADLTLTGQLLGTPNYMAPEQADPKRAPTTAASDVYSLGAILYQLLTGRPPFVAETITQTLRLVAETEPVSPRLLNPNLSRDLETICVKCLEKDPQRRYTSAQELADELGHFLRDEPIQARPISASAKLARWCLRKPALAVAIGAACVLLMVVAIGSPIALFRINHARKLAKTAEIEQSRLRQEAEKAQANEAQGRRRAEAQELAARQKAYASDMKLLQQALAADDLGRAQNLLNRQRPRVGEADLRGWEWRYLWQFCQSDEAYTLCKRSTAILSVSFSSDNRLLAVGTQGIENHTGEVTVWDLATRQMVSRYGERGAFPRLSFAPDADVVAFYGVTNRQNSVVLWNARTGEEIRRLPVNGPVRNLAFTLDGRLFVADTSDSNNISTWKVGGEFGTNFSARVPRHLNGTVFAITSDGSRMAYGMQASPDFVQIMDANGRSDPSFRVADERITALAFSQDGRILATGGGYSEGAIKLWNVQTRQLIGTLEGHRSYVSCLKFLPDRRTLASASADRTIRLWDFETRQPIRTLRGHGGELWTFDVSPNGRWLASGGKDGSVILWDLTSPAHRVPKYRTLQLAGAKWWSYSPDGRTLAAALANELSFYDATTLQPMGGLDLTLTNISWFTFSPRGDLLLVSAAHGELGVWDLKHERIVTNFVPHTAAASVTAAFTTNGASVLTYGAGVFKEWDVATWQERRQWTVKPGLVFHWDFCPTGDLVATAIGIGLCEVIPRQDPDRRGRFKGQTRLRSLSLSPDGKIFSAASENGTVELWDTETLTRRALLHGVLLGYHSVTFSPDGRRLAAGSNGQEAIKMWDVHSQEEVATLSGEGSLFTHAKFSPEGDTIGALNLGGVLHLWSAPSWAEIEAVEKARGAAAP